MTAVPSARQVAKRLWYAPDRILHEQRRARAGRQIQDMRSGVPPRVLFLCYGNICRSPFAAAAMARAAPEGAAEAAIHSAGFFGPGRPSPEAAIDAARRRGVDLKAHRSRLVTEELAHSVDCVFVMEQRQRGELVRLLGRLESPVLVLGDLDPLPAERRTILDPYGKDPEFFDATFRRIERCVDTVSGLLHKGVG